MSTSRVINRWLNRVYKTIAILLVIFAVLISALRLFLPYVENYKDGLENFINNANGSHISIGKLSMEWEKLGPSIVLKQVSLLETQSTDIFIDKIHVHLDFWQSLLKGRVITQDVTLDGAQVFIKSLHKSSKEIDKDKPLIARVTEMFLDQISRFSLHNSQIIFQTNQTEKVLVINELDWLNDGDRHRAKGYVILDGLTSNNIKVLLDLHGDDIEDLDGQVYLQANQLNITPWLDTIFAIDNRDTHSAINFDGWLSIKKGMPSSLLIALGNNEISWTHKNIDQFFSINQGYLLANFGDGINQNNEFKTFNVASSPLTIITPKNTWDPTSIQFEKKAGVYNGYISHLNVQGLTEISPLFSNNENLTELLTHINPNGFVENLFVQLSENQQSIIADLKDINSYPYEKIPGISNLGGEVSFKDKTLRFKLNAEKGVLDYGEHFVKPIPYNQFYSDSRFTFGEDSWIFSSNDIEFTSDEISVSADVVVEKPQNEDAKMSLLTVINRGDAGLANHYYPQKIMGDVLVNYLNGALVKGNIDQGQVLFNGPLNKFPFENNEGIFTVDLEISDAEFKFQPKWPAIKNFNANLNFTNNSMLITGRSGDLENIDVSGVSVEIEDLKHATILEVNATFDNLKPEYVSNLMEKSPLQKTVGAALKSLVITGPISGDFGVVLPLRKPATGIVKGTVNFSDNNINLQAPNMLFTKVNGQLTFNNDKILTKDINLLWRGMPLALSVNAQDKGILYNTNIEIDADWNTKQWQDQLPEQLQTYGSGNLAWDGILSLNMFNQGGFTYDLDINSTLDTLVLELPEPYAKTSNEKVSANIQVTGQNKNTTINAAIGEQLTFYGVLDHEKVSFNKAHLVLGSEDMLLPTRGFHISSKLAQADVAQWQPFITDVIDCISGFSHPYEPQQTVILESPERITAKVDTLLYGDYSLSDALLTLTKNEQAWLIDINSKEVRSEVILNQDLYENGIEINADFVHLTKLLPDAPINEATELETAMDIAVKQDEINKFNQKFYTQLPPLLVNCESCKLDNLDFGKVSFTIKRDDENQIYLEQFKATRDKFTLNLEGYWSQFENDNITNIQGTLDLKDLEQETEKLGYTPTIKDSGLKSKFAFDWQASPYDFSIAKVNGQFNASLDDGYLAEVPDQARVFSVLSLQSLVRKLSFDFRDIFADGMFYRSIEGDFQMKGGIMYTDNMFMQGAAGDLEVKGNTDLGKEVLDIRMSYKPNVTSSLPALAWIATLNPVTFLAGLALEEVITSKVYYEMNFELTGSMSQPIFKDVNRKTRNISVGKTTPPQIIDELSPPDVILPSNEQELNSESKTIELPKKSEVDG
ncbi:YhdP family protein [Pseudocolwellia sp. HL-MZ19]|uniref:YhdP family protein n=1 Tax=unclassified Pseudocolwellia TaxID=2848178 RepID=UPI003CF49625